MGSGITRSGNYTFSFPNLFFVYVCGKDGLILFLKNEL